MLDVDNPSQIYSKVVRTMIDERVYTVKEVASLLKMHEESVRRIVKQGRMKAFRIGNGPRAEIRITESAIREFLS
jgi:excisionase family DNA binding protein